MEAKISGYDEEVLRPEQEQERHRSVVGTRLEEWVVQTTWAPVSFVFIKAHMSMTHWRYTLTLMLSGCNPGVYAASEFEKHLVFPT